MRIAGFAARGDAQMRMKRPDLDPRALRDQLVAAVDDRDREDPSQPFHFHNLVTKAREKAAERAKQGDFLSAHKALLGGHVAWQNSDGIANLSRALRSSAQHLHCLNEMNEALGVLLSERNEEFAMKLDMALVRRLFVVYESRVRSFFASPRYCLYSGIRMMAMKALDELKPAAMSSFRVGPREAGLLRQLHLWTACLEWGLAQSLDDCLAARDKDLGLLDQDEDHALAY
eukprot:evm.model.scf_1601.3 EVM.evm.TU.scf_1601.3   scf_1601:16935-22498(-)